MFGLKFGHLALQICQKAVLTFLLDAFVFSLLPSGSLCPFASIGFISFRGASVPGVMHRVPSLGYCTLYEPCVFVEC